jgi:hypothetical protein
MNTSDTHAALSPLMLLARPALVERAQKLPSHHAVSPRYTLPRRIDLERAQKRREGRAIPWTSACKSQQLKRSIAFSVASGDFVYCHGDGYTAVTWRGRRAPIV